MWLINGASSTVHAAKSMSCRIASATALLLEQRVHTARRRMRQSQLVDGTEGSRSIPATPDE